ncbi:MerR family transcriptional regulator [Catenovulum agarivorans]|uniref:MerR family transcriptional regulator n=1 Tax=Catenovulum agarivorans TaxID=1172192 RepID=UPI0002DFCFFE|nr:MerR family transcriptional regulator [Catenovulum agarivorans]
MKENTPITIGVLAKSANVGVETIRYYQRKEIIRQPEKTNGFRRYSNEDIRTVRLVKKLQTLGFSLDEIKEFLVFDRSCSKSQKVVKQKSLAKIQELNQKIVELQATVKALETFSEGCGCSSESASCELLQCFENEWKCCGSSI